MKVYDSNGWVNWEYFMGLGKPFLMMVGSRGVGKTYGLFKYMIERNYKFIYLRRLQSQLDICGSMSGNPFKKLNKDMGINIVSVRHKKLLEFRKDDASGDIVAVGSALSTVATMRGFDYSDYDYIVFDECVPMIGEKPIKEEFNAFLNFYETVNRNRELGGETPVQCIMLGNANQLINPYFNGWHFTKIALKMIKGRQMVYNSPDNTRTIVLLQKSPISSLKSNTALYRNASDDFISMALDNAFRTDATCIHSEPLKEYIHIVSVGDIGIYRHKSKRKYYVSSVLSEPYYDGFGIQLRQYQVDYYRFRNLYMESKVFVFENYENEILFREYLKLN